MNNQPLVSVIVPVYNVASYLGRMLKSLQAQTYENIEIILIDDGSTDGSYEVAQELLQNYEFAKARLERQDNAGVSAARNHGLELAQGEYLVFADSDDVLSPRYIQNLYEGIQEQDAQLAVCEHLVFSGDEELCVDLRRSAVRQTIQSTEMMKCFLYGFIKISICSIMVERRIIDEFRLRFANGYRYSEDIHFVWRVLAHVDKAVYDPEPLYFYRARPSSAMAKFGKERIHGMQLMEDVQKYYQQCGHAFAAEFATFGVAKWVWSTLWQAACALDYKAFQSFSSSVEGRKQCRTLRNFPTRKVRWSSRLFLLAPRLYYFFVRAIASYRGMNRF